MLVKIEHLNLHNVPQLEPRMYEGACLVVGGGERGAAPAHWPGRRRRRVAVSRAGAVRGRIPAHARRTAAPAHGRMPPSHAAQHPKTIVATFENFCSLTIVVSCF